GPDVPCDRNPLGYVPVVPHGKFNVADMGRITRLEERANDLSRKVDHAEPEEIAERVAGKYMSCAFWMVCTWRVSVPFPMSPDRLRQFRVVQPIRRNDHTVWRLPRQPRESSQLAPLNRDIPFQQQNIIVDAIE